ncbi:hypothetical protein EHO60_13290 [Leptospira fletcheri]|uniref:Apea-like HEPN domain-containing protein n=1 Tax=Leptospira fletcheri TaxID=2484981 RepID=A0A4R9GBE6_9LEPT|nr:hypothetical protein [Leptospira fletcheri]TGK08993.1 hypothetical protein EHO60_13290 [Leptospira fletcheri]
MENELGTFLRNNSQSSLKKENEQWIVESPWDDESIHLYIQEKQEIYDCLNNLVLPYKFTALYHSDLKCLEFIYTLQSKDANFEDDNFEFIFDSVTYKCSYKDSSDRLLLVANVFRPSGKETNLGYRNLFLLNAYTQSLSSTENIEPPFPSPDFENLKPISFFIEGIEVYDEQKLVSLAKHLNFYMSYYDRKAPNIIIHPDRDNSGKPNPQLQLIDQRFPSRIQAQSKDPFLIDLALSARESGIRLKYLYSYQILEYAAFYFLEEDVKRKVTMLLKSPVLLSKTEEICRNILDAITDIKQNDEAKINKVVETFTDPEIIWKEIQENIDFFSNPTEFDGGFRLSPLISSNTTIEAFKSTWIPKVPDTLRKIRNALVHGRESRLGLIIAPGTKNNLKLRPWVPLIQRISEQVIIFN